MTDIFEIVIDAVENRPRGVAGNDQDLLVGLSHSFYEKRVRVYRQSHPWPCEASGQRFVAVYVEENEDVGRRTRRVRLTQRDLLLCELFGVTDQLRCGVFHGGGRPRACEDRDMGVRYGWQEKEREEC